VHEPTPGIVAARNCAWMNRDYVKAQIKNRKLTGQAAS